MNFTLDCLTLMTDEALKRSSIKNDSGVGGNGHQKLSCVILGKGTQCLLRERYKQV